MVTDIRVDWETYNIDPNDRKLLDLVVAFGGAFPLKDADGNEVVSGGVRLPERSARTSWRNTPPSSERSHSSLQSLTVSTFHRVSLK